MKTKFRSVGVFLFSSLLLGSLMITSCKKDSGSSNNGKTDPSTIATSDLIAYFPFENNGNDVVGSLSPTTAANITYVTGKRGKAYQGGDSAYFLYNLPAASKLKTLKAFSISMWFYGPPALDTVAPVPGILQIDGTTDPAWGNLCLTQDRMPATSDSLNIKIVFHKDGVDWANQFVGFSNPAFVKSHWFHIIYTYDNVASKYMVYVNGAPLNLSDGIVSRFANGNTPQTPLGDLVFSNAAKFAIGGWMARINNNSQGSWQGWFKGQMDELRIYDRALTAEEAMALFNAEVTELN